MQRKFDWNTDCGPDVSPSLAATAAREAGQSYEEYAQQYLDHWPFDESPPPDLIEGMVRDMEAAG